jgi:hypothetical protein
MPWTVRWLDDDERALVLTPVDPWTWDEFKESTQTAQDLTKGKPYRVDLIFNLGSDLKLPRPKPGEHMAAWMPMLEMLKSAPDNRGTGVIVAAPLFIESAVRSLKAIAKDDPVVQQIKFVETIDEARAIIRKVQAARDEP